MWNYLIPTILLFLFGVFNLLGTKPDLAVRHGIFFVIGLSVFFLFRKIGSTFIRSNVVVIYIIFIILFILTLLIGDPINGSRRWLNLYFFNFQTSEFFKIFFILFIASFLAYQERNLNSFSTYLFLLFTLLIPSILVFVQPDLAGTIVIVIICFSMILFSEVPKRYIGLTCGLVLILLPFLWLFVLQDYQKDRVYGFINPSSDVQGVSYNRLQSMITTGSGRFTGKGLGLGEQSKLYFLPENHTDFAYASITEQFGFIGGLAILMLYGALTVFIFQNIFKYFGKKGTYNRYQYFYSIGFATFFLFQVFVNIGMNLGMIPIAGVVLPLVSFGGSSIVTWMIGLALLDDKKALD